MGFVLGGLLVVGWVTFFVSGAWHGQSGPYAGVRAIPAQAGHPVAPGGVNSSPASPQPVRADTRMTVYVTGAVKHPGLYELPLDARMIAAVDAAGGALPSADLGAIDLAAVVEDGMQIVVPDQSQAVTASGARSAFSMPQANANAKLATRSARRKHKLPPGARIDLNQANLVQFEELPGIGSKKAQAILSFRQRHGLFTALQELGQVSGIGPRLLSRVLPHVTLSGP